jgi:ribose transport system permease protein
MKLFRTKRRRSLSLLAACALGLVALVAVGSAAGGSKPALHDAANSTYGANDLLNAIAAVVIGGTALTGGVGSVIGTAFGVLIIVTIQNGLTLLNVSPLWTVAFVGGAILAAAIIHRLSGARSAE